MSKAQSVNQAEHIWLLDHDPGHIRDCEAILRHKLGYTVLSITEGGRPLTEWLMQPPSLPDIIMMDVGFASQMQLMSVLRSVMPQVPLIALLPYMPGEGENSQLDEQFWDFLSKPIELARMRITLRNALHMRRVNQTLATLERHAQGEIELADIIGDTPAMRRVKRHAEAASQTAAPLWIEGEAGTGKTLLAQAVHHAGNRRDHPLIMVDCAELSGNGEIVLFGGRQEAGGAMVAGKIKLADRSTLLLKNVAHLAAPLQQKLLEVVMENRVRPAGSDASIHVDVRVICTGKPSDAAILRDGRFSPMLYRTLRAQAIEMPPLASRIEDIEKISIQLCQRFAAIERKQIRGFSPEALELLKHGAWPGNIRQLAHIIWRAVLLCESEWLEAGHIRQKPVENDHTQAQNPLLVDAQGHIKNLKLIEEEAIRFALRSADGCMTRAAKKLGIGRSTLYRRVQDLNIADYRQRANQITRPAMEMASSGRS